MTNPQGYRARHGLAYGLLGLPLAFVALPLYVVLPNHYAREFGLSLSLLGLVLLGARLFDALIDPWIGRLVDRLYQRGVPVVLGAAALCALVLVAGFVALFFPPRWASATHTSLLAWLSVALVLTYAAYSGISVAHQSWAAMLGGDETQRSRVVAWREGLALLGVLIASALPSLAGLAASAVFFALGLALALAAWRLAPRPQPALREQPLQLGLPLTRSTFRRLLLVFVLNGIASAVPATLVLFFVQDRLQAPEALQPYFLASYFACAALGLPLWLALVRRVGLARTWLLGMGLAMSVFVWAATLGAGDSVAFLWVCALSGLALGADLALPSALLAGVIARAGDQGRAEGAYFGWWNFATKLNLALAAGLALPLLQWAGYSPGARDATALQALVIAYCVLPCLLKALAAGLLYLLLIRPQLDQ